MSFNDARMKNGYCREFYGVDRNKQSNKHCAWDNWLNMLDVNQHLWERIKKGERNHVAQEKED